MDFPAVAKRELRAREARIEKRLCPDQYFGKVKLIERAGELSVRQAAVHRTAEKCLLLVLESPHVSEFDNDPGPAKGTSGKNIAKFLRQVRGLESFGDHGLILINAIQYQCSLGFATDEFRDRVFTELWNTGGREDFISRLTRLYKAGDTLVNCCTKGAANIPSNELRVLVQSAICHALLGVSVMRRNHPSCWHFRAKRQHEWQTEA